MSGFQTHLLNASSRAFVRTKLLCGGGNFAESEGQKVDSAHLDDYWAVGGELFMRPFKAVRSSQSPLNILF